MKTSLRGRLVCRRCRYILESRSDKCPLCGSRDFSSRWEGIMIILSMDSKVAELMGVEKEGRYAIKIF